MTPPPGWYRDPMSGHPSRWWDGQRWTEHFRSTTANPGSATPQFNRPTILSALRATTSRHGRSAVFAVAVAMCATAGVIGAHLLSDAGQGSGWFDRGYELGRNAVPIVEDGYSPEVACDLVVGADTARVGHRRPTAQVKELKRGCLDAVQDLTT